MKIKDLGLEALYKGRLDTTTGFLYLDETYYVCSDYDLIDDVVEILDKDNNVVGAYYGVFNNNNFVNKSKGVDTLCRCIVSKHIRCVGCEFFFGGTLVCKVYYNGRYIVVQDVFKCEYLINKDTFNKFFEI